ncbi:hypothetical protein SAMN05444344_2981 [Tenacibaculum mesophilum]|uniref:Lipoprotein n=1 Tax=Tenacibaculum mesophilum TaxID=104268 RepID=A0AAE9MMQ6_9FLAO|nr:hypothetical protein [Tenacibaculum mesophilum]AZJ32219.1 hypothetical protein D6200_06425 [Tenacibaculum mesophilum]QFS27475.1 hypothetical protein F9Y86_03285 [Tenacibaculum mesophilum]UTD14899.1 hypothetical protein HER15_05145 [Tenacibaculum mesophilum]SHG17352.1 hypothetical protein SAMN05444344_2981 [Tenacibaculum mesophilum]
MRKLIFLVFLTLISCSIKTEFFIYNTSDELVTIEYKFHEETIFGGFVSNPVIMESNWLSKLKEIESSELSVDFDKNIVTCILKKGQAIKLGWIGNYSPKSDFKRQELSENLKELRIIRNGKDTRIIKERDNVADLFKRVNSRRYEMKIIK